MPADTGLPDRVRRSAIIFKAEFADRIAQLVAAYAEDYAGATLSVDSLDALVVYLETRPTAARPEITATPSGDLYAEWRAADGRQLAIEFLASGVARYLIVRPNPKHPRRLDRLTGTTTADALAETLAPLVPISGLAA